MGWLVRVLFGEDVVAGDLNPQIVKRHCERYQQAYHPTAKVAVEIGFDDRRNVHQKSVDER